MVLIIYTADWMITQNKIKSFRPLAGIMVLISYCL